MPSLIEQFLPRKSLSFNLDHYKTLVLRGADVTSFLNGQLTNDVTLLQNGEFQLSARTDRTGKVLCHLIVIREDTNGMFLLIPAEYAQQFLDDIENFLISEDVEIQAMDVSQFSLHYNDKLDSLYAPADRSKIHFEIGKDKEIESTIKGDEILQSSLILNLPVKDVDYIVGELITETILNDIAVSHKKGCYLGQETIAKINSRRGPSHLSRFLLFSSDMLQDSFLVEGKKIFKQTRAICPNLIKGRLHRDFSTTNKTIKFDNGLEAQVLSFKLEAPKEPKSDPYLSAVKLFNSGAYDNALTIIEGELAKDSNLEDFLEIKGLILDKTGETEKAIKIMEKIIEINPKATMAFTNLSRFYLKLGSVEKAEDYKSKSMLSELGGETNNEDKAKAQETLRRQGMFLRVLEMDPEDTLANCGLGQIEFESGNYIKAIKYLKQVLEVDDNYSIAYKFLGQSYMNLQKIDEAKTIFEKGIKVASKKGDLMPAQDMQDHLNQLN